MAFRFLPTFLPSVHLPAPCFCLSVLGYRSFQKAPPLQAIISNTHFFCCGLLVSFFFFVYFFFFLLTVHTAEGAFPVREVTGVNAVIVRSPAHFVVMTSSGDETCPRPPSFGGIPLFFDSGPLDGPLGVSSSHLSFPPVITNMICSGFSALSSFFKSSALVNPPGTATYHGFLAPFDIFSFTFLLWARTGFLRAH